MTLRHTVLLLVIMVAVVSAAAGCARNTPGISPERDAWMREWCDAADQAGKVFAGIKDQASAEAAKPKLEALAKTIDALLARGAKLSKPDEVEQLKLVQKYGERDTDINYVMSREPRRIAGQFPDLAKTVKDISAKIMGRGQPGG